MKDNIILVDCDGVLCNWEYAFTQWMEHTKGIKTKLHNEYNVGKRFGLTKAEGKEMVAEFNDSAAIAKLLKKVKTDYYEGRVQYKLNLYLEELKEQGIPV